MSALQPRKPRLALDGSGSAAHLVSRRYAWGVTMMVVALAATDYIDRQIIVSAFPYLKSQWGLSDTALGALVSTVSVTIAVCALPTARLADRWGRVKSITLMGGVWSVAALWCGASGNYAQLFAARSLLGAGEAGYGPAGAALLSSYHPQRLRATVLSLVQAAGPLGSVIGVAAGGVLIEHWGWRVTLAAFGVPGLVLAVLFLRVRDYRPPAAPDRVVGASAVSGGGGTAQPTARATVRELFRTRTATWCYIGGALNLVTLSTLYTWLPSYFSRYYGLSSAAAGAKTALVILAGVIGAIVLGNLADRRGAADPRSRLLVPAAMAVATWLVLTAAFAGTRHGGAQYALLVAAGFPLAAALGTAPAAVVDVVAPGVRATAVGMVALAQNLLGLAVGPVLTGLLSDAFGLETTLAVMPLFCAVSAVAFWRASQTYEKDFAAATGGVPAASPESPEKEFAL